MCFKFKTAADDSFQDRYNFSITAHLNLNSLVRIDENKQKRESESIINEIRRAQPHLKINSYYFYVRTLSK